MSCLTALAPVNATTQKTTRAVDSRSSMRVRKTHVRGLFRVLIVEDSAEDAEMVELALSQAGYSVTARRVISAVEFSDAIATRDWDAIIADYTLPGFGALPALDLLKQSAQDIPFIIMSGTISDEIAVSAMRAGAHDYVLKDNIARLVPAIEREIREAETRRKKSQADEAVRYLSAIVESSDDAIIGKTLEGIVTSWNRGAERLYGYTAAEILGRSISALIPPDRQDELNLILSKIAQGERVDHFETVRRRKDGTLVELSVKVSPILDAMGNITGASTMARDITEQKRAEAALLRSEKLASVGRMAAAVAHEINNPLAAVTNLLFLTKGIENLPEGARQNLEQADAELRRIAHITRQSLGFYRESNGLAPTYIGEALESAVDLLKSKIKAKHAVIEKQWDEDFKIAAVSGELRQVFCNLLANSLDAIDEKGTIKLRLSIGAALRDARAYVRVTIADNGRGISTTARPHIFEPFFSTKGAIGTGLGLWVSKQIVENHGGIIRLRSNICAHGRGTAFSVFLPVEPAVKATVNDRRYE